MSVVSTNPFFDPFVNPFRVLVMSNIRGRCNGVNI